MHALFFDSPLVLSSRHPDIGPLQYDGVGGAASRGMRVKAFYVLLARAPEKDEDMRSMREVRTVGKEVVLVQVRCGRGVSGRVGRSLGRRISFDTL